MSRVLLVSPEVVRSRMAGPGLRFWNMAKTLAKAGHEVTLGVEDESDLEGEGFDVRTFTRTGLDQLVARSDVVVSQGLMLSHYPGLRGRPPLVMDLYDPFHVEAYESYRREPAEQRRALAEMLRAVVSQQLEQADFFLCAGERQRAFWLGHLALLGRLTPEQHDLDPTFRRLVDVVPFGIEPDAPVADRPFLKGVRHGISADHRVVLWSGGIYDWLDPATVVRAFRMIAPSHDDAHLVFLGAHYPNPAAPPSRAVAATRQLAIELAVPRVHFHDEWVPFGSRGSLLLEADVGVSAHPATLESELAQRTRLLDHIWSGLPTVATEGDEVIAIMEEAGAALTVPPGDAGAMAEALAHVLDNDALRAGMAAAAARLAPRMTWERQLQPLMEFCAQPRRLEAAPRRSGRVGLGRAFHLGRRFFDYARAGEWRLAAKRVRTTLQPRRR